MFFTFVKKKIVIFNTTPGFMHQKFKVSWVVGIMDWPIKSMDNSLNCAIQSSYKSICNLHSMSLNRYAWLKLPPLLLFEFNHISSCKYKNVELWTHFKT